MATTKPKKTQKKSSTKPKASEKTVKAEKIAKPEKVAAVQTEKVEKEACNACACGLFERKFDASENILTIFKTPRIWGALIGEAIGTMLLTMLLMALGVNNILFIMFGMAAVIMAVHKLSGAHLNPLVTVGMMATRRVSAIRGVLYIIAQVVGAWLGMLLLNAFIGAGGDNAILTTMAEVTSENFGLVIMIEILGAVMIGFFYARALQYKRSALTFALLIMGGLSSALIMGLMLSGSYLGLSSNFIMNPAIALMMQIFPTAGETFGEVMGGVGLALAAYVVFPMIAGTVGFFISDIASKLSGEAVCEK